MIASAGPAAAPPHASSASTSLGIRPERGNAESRDSASPADATDSLQIFHEPFAKPLATRSYLLTGGSASVMAGGKAFDEPHLGFPSGHGVPLGLTVGTSEEILGAPPRLGGARQAVRRAHLGPDPATADPSSGRLVDEGRDFEDGQEERDDDR